jgi:MFS family permease
VALRWRDFRLMLAGNVVSTLGLQMQTTAVGWELYERTHSAYALGIVGLVSVVPLLALALPAGHIVDTRDRRHVLVASQAIYAVSSVGLALVSWRDAPLLAFYGCILLAGIARAFQAPARNALLPSLVPPEALANAVTWNSGGWQLAAVLGPAAGGAMIAWFGGATGVYLFAAGGSLVALTLAAAIRHRPSDRLQSRLTLTAVVAGIRFVARTPLILATITLDLFAVLLGGATTLLPIYAKDILQVGPTGLGWLTAADSLGAVLMAAALAARPPLRHAGQTVLWAVAGFGLATFVFGVSKSFPLSLAMLMALGAFDMVSIVVRGTLVPLLTPDEMRGRVGAITNLFVGTSNQLGGFESGIVAGAFGPVFSVVSGAIGTVIVVGVAAWHWPELRRLGALDGATTGLAADGRAAAASDAETVAAAGQASGVSGVGG